MGIKMAATRSPRHNQPEAITNILVRIIEKTPTGGATIEDMEEAYEEVKGSFPSRKTIYRALERLELLFDPLASGEDPGEGEDKEEGEVKSDPAGREISILDDDLAVPLASIKLVKRKRKTYYLLDGYSDSGADK